MPILEDEQPEDFGRGRHHDSSSSRDSSPERKQKRSFTPTSDDGDLVVPPAVDDDTPPPEDRPIIRQAVGFSWGSDRSTTALKTYEASLPSTAEKTVFLPGQQILLPPPPPPKPIRTKRSTERKRSSKAKVRHYNDQFSDKTASFRLDNYVTDPNAPTGKLPISMRDRPNASLYRAASSDPTSRSGASPFSSLPILHQRAPLGSPTPTMMTSSTHSPRTDGFNFLTDGTISPTRSTSTSLNSTPVPQATRLPELNAKASRPKVKAPRSRTKAPSSNAKAGPSSAKGPGEQYTTSTSTQAVSQSRRSDRMTMDNSATSSAAQISGSSYYRRDYEQAQELNRDSTTSNSRGDSPRQFVLMETNLYASSSSSAIQAQTLSSTNPQQTSATENGPPSSGVSVPGRQVRMLTLLIEDIRSGVTDHQLAEVKVPLRAAEHPEDGYWADAKDVCAKLQSSPSRIDGPAKVYTLRGIYRQFFLRVSADNVDDCLSANLIVSPERTLDVVVEPNPQPDGSLPLPPKIPRELIRTPTPDSDESSPSSMHHHDFAEHHSGSTADDLIAQLNRNLDRQQKRPRQSSPDDYQDLYDAHSPMKTSSYGSSPHGTPSASVPSYTSSLTNAPPRKKRSYAQGSSQDLTAVGPASYQTNPIAIRKRMEPQRPDSPVYDASPEELDALIVKAIEPLITKLDAWKDFIKAKAGCGRVSDILGMYRFVQHMMDEWDGKRAPFRSSNHLVHKRHVLDALNFDQKFGLDCTETLGLLELYGLEGKRLEDPRVIEMLNDKSVPPRNAKMGKRLLRLLREIDQNWLENWSRKQIDEDYSGDEGAGSPSG